ncbi:hypothetical protein Tco_0063525 [Tanacetum coccineum]
MGARNLEVNVDSKLVANQVNGTYIAKEADMIKYLEKVLVEELREKSVNEKEVLAVVEKEGDTWMTPIHEYLTDETLPSKRRKARAIKHKLQRFAIINRTLYKKSFLGPWLRCVGPSQANYVLQEIHEGSTAEVNVAENDEALEINLDLIEEKREQAAIREAKSKRQMEKYYNTKVRNTSLKPGDLVY